MSEYFSDFIRANLANTVGYYDQLAPWYDLFFDDPAGSMDEEGKWLHGVLVQYGVRSVLDASCGSGRQSLPLLKHGYHVMAADPSIEMLRQARIRAEVAGRMLLLHCAAFRQLPEVLGRRFDAVIALGNGLAHLPGLEEIAEALRALRQCCDVQGLCLIGTKDFDRIRVERPQFRGHGARSFDGERTVLFEVWEYDDLFLESTAFLVSETAVGPTVRSASTREYMLSERELVELAHESGFRETKRLDRRGEAVYALMPE